jgi:hypothetical protein
MSRDDNTYPWVCCEYLPAYIEPTMQTALNVCAAHLYLLYIPNPDNKTFALSDADKQWDTIQSRITSSIAGIQVLPLCGATKYVGTEGGTNWTKPTLAKKGEPREVFPDTGEPNDRRLPYALWFMTIAHPLDDTFLTRPTTHLEGQLVGEIKDRLELQNASVLKRIAVTGENDPSAKLSAIQTNSINAQALALEWLGENNPSAITVAFAQLLN